MAIWILRQFVTAEICFNCVKSCQILNNNFWAYYQMDLYKNLRTLSIVPLLTLIPLAYAAEELPLVTIEEQLFKDTTVVSPATTVTEEQLEKINFATAEDAIGLEPSLVVRRRFIGDPNGVIGIRGSNMFQGHRSLVFSDGLPLHYHLQTRFSGAPRWSLVAPGEIEEVEVIYGPFSAEYSGNSMGGVVNIKTKSPAERKFTLAGSLFSQDYDELGTNENFNGGKGFFSYEDKIGNLTLFASYNHLENESQPLSFFFDEFSAGTGGVAVSGAFSGEDEFEVPVFYYGDSGTEKARTDLFKIKLGYDLGDYELRASLAYEERERRLADINNFVVDSMGNPVWDGMVHMNGQEFRMRGNRFEERYQERDSLLFGLGLSGPVADSDWVFDLYFSEFDILKDNEIRTGRNPEDPDFITENTVNFAGRFTDSDDDTGWRTFDTKAGTDYLFGSDRARLSIGYHYDRYELSIEPFRYDSINDILGADRGASGGQTSTQALFAQFGYALSDKLDLALGLRYEDWETSGGFSRSGTTLVERRDEQEISPKFSLGYFPTDDIVIRYSLARAVRFPLVEELFRNESAGTRQFISDPALEPEDGIHHNLSFEKFINNGSVRFNLFHEVIDDVIFTFSATDLMSNTITTTLPVDEVTTTGIEFIYNQNSIYRTPFDMRFNVAYTDAQITENNLNPDIENNEFPRIPEWRSNLLVTYNFSDMLNLNTSIRYASDTYGELDNSDRAEEVFGAQDEYLFVNMKANWQATKDVRIGAGVENVFNEEAYVFHPWPSRTFFMEGRYIF